MSIYRPEFEDALRLLARVSTSMKERGLAPPILVGGAAVELYANSTINTGDFDIVTSSQDAFEEELRANGFVRPSGPWTATRGWVHPELQLGFEVVGDQLLDGMADRNRVLMIDFGRDGEISIVSVEDIIADRVGQYASGTAPEMLEQAKRLFDLHFNADLAYMDKRIRYESAGDYDISCLKR